MTEETDTKTCNTCNALLHGWPHKCPPRWRVFVDGHHDPEDADDGVTVHAAWPDLAATEAIEEWDDERSVLGGPVRVQVRPEGHAQQGGWFEVSAEATVDYHARAVAVPEVAP